MPLDDDDSIATVDTGIQIQFAIRSTEGKKNIIHDKKHACWYCKKLLTNIWRHYETVHCDEKEVSNIIKNGKSWPTRAKEIDKLRLLGNYLHNLEVLATRSGMLIVVRRPSTDKTVDAVCALQRVLLENRSVAASSELQF